MVEEYTVKYKTIYYIMKYDSTDNTYSFDGQDFKILLNLNPNDLLYPVIGKTITDKEMYQLLKTYTSLQLLDFFQWFINEILIRKIHLLFDIRRYEDVETYFKLVIVPSGTPAKDEFSCICKGIPFTQVLPELERLLDQLPNTCYTFKPKLINEHFNIKKAIIKTISETITAWKKSYNL